MSNGLLLLIRLVLSVAAAAAISWAGFSLGGKAWGLVGFVVAVPIIGFAIARPLIEFVHEGTVWLSQQPMKKWEGNFYAFNDVQVRIFEYKDELWFAAADVLKSTGIAAVPDSLLAIYPEGCRVIPGTRLTCLNMKAVEKFLASHREPEAQRFVLWARREVIAPWTRKREGSAMIARL
jgi:hypothetical protein